MKTASSSWILPVPPGQQVFWKIFTVAISIRKPCISVAFGFSSMMLDGHRNFPGDDSQRSIKQLAGVCKQPTGTD